MIRLRRWCGLCNGKLMVGRRGWCDSVLKLRWCVDNGKLMIRLRGGVGCVVES